MNEKLGRFVVDRPALTVLIVLFITFMLGFLSANPEVFGLERYDEERENDWLPDSEIVRADNEISDEYGLQVSYLQVIVKADNILDKGTLIEILELEMSIAMNETVRDILFPAEGSISSISTVVVFAHWQMHPEMNLSGNMPSDPMSWLRNMSQDDVNNTITALENAEFAQYKPSMLLSKDFGKNLDMNLTKAKGTMILVMIDSSVYDEIDGDDNPVLDADKAILRIIDDQEFEHVKDTGLIENEYVTYRIGEDSGGVMAALLQMAFVLIIIILFITYRSIFDTVISLAALIFAITWMNGIGVILGLTFSTMYDVVPIMIMGLGIDYAIHLVMRYREERLNFGKTIRDALILTSVSVGAALFLATLTTSISFGSNTVSEIKPMREFAIFALIGIVSAFITMTTFVPASKMLFHRFQRRRGIQEFKVRRTASKRRKNGSALSRLLAKGAVAAEHHAYPVIAVVIAVSIISTGLAMQLETEFDFTEFLPENSEITDDIIYMTDNFDFGTEQSNVLVRGDISDPDVLLAMAETEENILDDTYVNEGDPIESILTLMRTIANGQFILNGSMAADPVFAQMYNESDQMHNDSVPDTNITDLFDYLRLDPRYDFSTVRVLHYNEGKDTYDGAVIRVSVNSQNAAKAKDISEDLENDIAPLERESAVDSVITTSGPVLIHYIISSIEISGIQSLIITVVIAGIVLTIVFYVTDRSWILGILTEIPVILVIAWVFASMYLIGMSLNVMTIMIASLTVGLGITYGIHITHRFVEDLRKMDDIDEACRSTVINTGNALFGAAVTTIGGFAILIFAPIPPVKMFGSITALAIAFSLIASVFVLPTFLTIWAKFVKKRDPSYFRNHADVKKAMEKGGLSYETPEDDEKVRKPVKRPKKVVRKPSPRSEDIDGERSGRKGPGGKDKDPGDVPDDEPDDTGTHEPEPEEDGEPSDSEAPDEADSDEE